MSHACSGLQGLVPDDPYLASNLWSVLQRDIANIIMERCLLAQLSNLVVREKQYAEQHKR